MSAASSAQPKLRGLSKLEYREAKLIRRMQQSQAAFQAKLDTIRGQIEAERAAIAEKMAAKAAAEAERPARKEAANARRRKERARFYAKYPERSVQDAARVLANIRMKQGNYFDDSLVCEYMEWKKATEFPPTPISTKKRRSFWRHVPCPSPCLSLPRP